MAKNFGTIILEMHLAPKKLLGGQISDKAKASLLSLAEEVEKLTQKASLRNVFSYAVWRDNKTNFSSPPEHDQFKSKLRDALLYLSGVEPVGDFLYPYIALSSPLGGMSAEEIVNKRKAHSPQQRELTYQIYSEVQNAPILKLRDISYDPEVLKTEEGAKLKKAVSSLSKKGSITALMCAHTVLRIYPQHLFIAQHDIDNFDYAKGINKGYWSLRRLKM